MTTRYDKLPGEPTELVVALVGPVGADKDVVISALKDQLPFYIYDIEVVKISDLIQNVISKKKIKKPESIRIKNLMNEGNQLRKNHGNSILAKLVSSAINSRRKERKSSKKKVLWLIDSLKHPAEVKALRQIYGVGFYQISIHVDKERRKRYLVEAKHIAESEADHLIERDQQETESHGQQTRKAFQYADYFVNYNGNVDKINNSIARFLKLIFAHPYTTPTFNEYAMFIAYVSAIRSADLSRQVGAVVTKDKEILSMGANECPKAGGSRSGDIFMVLNGKEGYLAVNKKDGHNGWHGGPTEAESFVPLMFSMPGPALINPQGRSNPKFVKDAFDAYEKANKIDDYLRNYQLSGVIEAIMKKAR